MKRNKDGFSDLYKTNTLYRETIQKIIAEKLPKTKKVINYEKTIRLN